MDILSGEDLYEEYMVFKETTPPSEQFAFFEIENSNFMLNSGSYFVIFLSMICYYFSAYIINKVCVCNAKYAIARNIGVLFHEDDYWTSFIKASFKLFLESYFDLVMCAMLNLHGFINQHDEWKSFFATRDD